MQPEESQGVRTAGKQCCTIKGGGGAEGVSLSYPEFSAKFVHHGLRKE
jgi:hypothetical protein